MPVIPALRRQRQEELKFQAVLPTQKDPIKREEKQLNF
jgi:hypothetical protein